MKHAVCRLCILVVCAFALTARASAYGACVGDCDDNGRVAISELLLGVNIALGRRRTDACPAFRNQQGEVDVAQLVNGVGNALRGCSDSAEQFASIFALSKEISARFQDLIAEETAVNAVGSLAAQFAD